MGWGVHSIMEWGKKISKGLIVGYILLSFVYLCKITPIQHEEWIQPSWDHQCLNWIQAKKKFKNPMLTAEFMINQKCDQELQLER